MFTASHLPRQSPESQGVSSARILDFINAVEGNGIEFHSFMVVRHSNVITEAWWAPYAAEHPHLLYSFSKSFTSTAAGFAVDAGAFSLDDKVITFFPDDLPTEVSPNLAAMKVRHLLSMATGHTEEPSRASDNWVRAFFEKPVTKEPGTHFLYNSMATYLVSAIIQKTTGQRTTEYLDSHLFQPLGIVKLHSERCPRGFDIGGWGMSAKTEDMAKLAQLYLQRGVWNGQRLLSEQWVAAATSKQVSNGDNPDSDWCQGYGFQFWRSRHGCYRGDGAFGQYGVVMPAQDAVVAITSLVGDMQKPLNLVWEHLLPALGAEPLPEEPVAQQALAARLAALSVPAPQGETASARAGRVCGVTYRFEPNDQKVATMRFDCEAGGGRLTVIDDHGEHFVEWGQADWKRGTTTYKAHSLGDRGFLRTAARGGWTSGDTIRIKLALYETPFCPVITCKFGDQGVTFDMQGPIGFGPGERPALEGRRVS